MTDKKSRGTASTRLRFVTLAMALTLTASILSASAIERGALASHETSEAQDAQPLHSTPASPDAAAGAAAGAEHFTPEEREALDAIIRDYLLENPEVILEAVRRLEMRQRAEEQRRQREALVAERQRLLDGENAPILGNPEGDVALVEFFDYNCPYCKRMADDMRDLIQGDENLKVIMREFPILSEGSRFAARAALAARKQGKYEEFHFALLRAKGRVNEQLTLVIAENVGIDVERLRADMDGPEIQAHIDESRRLAEVLGVRGTPAFVVGSEFIPGAVSLSQLREAIEEARKES